MAVARPKKTFISNSPTLKTYRENNEQYTVSSQTARYEIETKKFF